MNSDSEAFGPYKVVDKVIILATHSELKIYSHVREHSNIAHNYKTTFVVSES